MSTPAYNSVHISEDDIQLNIQVKDEDSNIYAYKRGISNNFLRIITLYLILAIITCSDFILSNDNISIDFAIFFKYVCLPGIYYTFNIITYTILTNCDNPDNNTYYRELYSIRLWILNMIGGVGVAIFTHVFIKHPSLVLINIWIALMVYLFVLLIFAIFTSTWNVILYIPYDDYINCCICTISYLVLLMVTITYVNY